MEQRDVMAQMIGLYCRKNHKQDLCQSCQELYDYACLRDEKCPRKGEKTFCSTCHIHCYKPDMREKMRQVMKFSGPRMLFYQPKLALAHVWDTVQNRRKS